MPAPLNLFDITDVRHVHEDAHGLVAEAPDCAEAAYRTLAEWRARACQCGWQLLPRRVRAPWTHLVWTQTLGLYLVVASSRQQEEAHGIHDLCQPERH